MSELVFNERWPERADSVSVARGELCVYRDAMIFFPEDDPANDGDLCDLRLDASESATPYSALVAAEASRMRAKAQLLREGAVAS